MTGLGRKLSYVLNNFVKRTPNESKKTEYTNQDYNLTALHKFVSVHLKYAVYFLIQCLPISFIHS